jgi:hypothetical protein
MYVHCDLIAHLSHSSIYLIYLFISFCLSVAVREHRQAAQLRRSETRRTQLQTTRVKVSRTLLRALK